MMLTNEAKRRWRNFNVDCQPKRRSNEAASPPSCHPRMAAEMLLFSSSCSGNMISEIAS
jgi:hypothetical protein